MRNVLLGVAIALGVHVLATVIVVICLECAPGPDELAKLDLSSVDLSFAEKEDAAAAVAPSMPSVAEPPPPKPRPVEQPPPPERPLQPLPPDPTAMRFVQPKEERPTMETPPPAAAPSPAVAPRQARIDAPPHPKKTIRPEYPKGARQRGEQGNVLLEIRVNAEGTVDEVKVVGSSGFAELDEAAVKAAKAARFTPAKSGGKPVASLARLPLAFKLR